MITFVLVCLGAGVLFSFFDWYFPIYPKELPAPADPAALLELDPADVRRELEALDREFPGTPALPPKPEPVPQDDLIPFASEASTRLQHIIALDADVPPALIGRAVRIPIDGEDMACRIIGEDERAGLLEVRLIKHDSGSGPSVWLPKEAVEDKAT